MTKETEALKLALITLEGWDNHDKWVWPETALEQAKRNTKEAITAIKEALAQPEEHNFCQRCGKRTADLTTIHTCTPPQIDPNKWAFDNGLEST